MKNINFSKLFSVILLAFVFTSCVEDDDFEVPRDAGQSPDISGVQVPLSSVNDQLAQAQQNGNETFTFESNTYFEGYVVSSDEAGNFFEELIIQDKTQDPTAGVRVSIDSSPLFGQFNFGRKVFVKLEGLTVGTDEGVVTLGIQSGDRIEALPEALLSETVLRDNVTEDIVPVEVSIGEFSEELENIFIVLPFVQFPRSAVLVDNPLTYAGEQTDDFDGERVVESCNSGSTTILSTSTFADFKSLELPKNAGSLFGVLARDFFDDKYIVRTINPSFLIFEEERCDPDFLFCDGESGGPDTIYSEDFENISSISQLNGWENVQVEGNVDYILGNFDNNNYAQISGFQAGEAYTSWLVTEEIDLSTTSLEELSMSIQSNFDNGTILEIYITDDYTGDVTTTEWNLLDLAVPNGPGNGFGSFESVGPVNISCAGDLVRIGFKYEGEDPGPSTRYHIDNISIEGQN